MSIGDMNPCDEWAVGDSPFDHAMMALDAIDHFSDRHDEEALMGEYDEAAVAESDDLAPWPETWDLDV